MNNEIRLPGVIAVPVLSLTLAVQLSACAGPTGSMQDEQGQASGDKSAQQTQQAAATESTSEAPRSGLDRLANTLAEKHEVFRIGEAVVLPLPDSELFGPDNNSVAISNQGGTLLSRIGEALKEYPDSRIYIQEYLPAANVQVQTRNHAMDQAYVIRSELIGRNIEPRRLIVDIEPRKSRPGKPSAEQTGKVSLEHRFDLHIVSAP